ncbi:MAG: hypothetical protein EA425_01675 [Puniceicoccaceae bacterium]|nr:MAG: hypothetical protein EA425_01675 [Puniceicoccaceae bacterium]
MHHLAVVDGLRPILSSEELIQFELHQTPYGQIVRRSLPDEEMPAEEIRRLLDAKLNQYLNGLGLSRR